MLFLLTIFEGLAARLAGRPTAMISHCTCYCWKGLGHLRDGAGLSAILFVCSFADVGSDPDPSLFWCNNETAVSGQSLESCKNNKQGYASSPIRAATHSLPHSHTLPHACHFSHGVLGAVAVAVSPGSRAARGGRGSGDWLGSHAAHAGRRGR